MPTKKEIVKYYESEYLGLNPSLHLEDSKFKACEIVSILEKMGSQKIDSMVFLGCGAGGVAKEMQKIIGDHFLVGCDISSSILQRNVNKNLLLIKADCEEIPLRNDSVDIVLLIDVIEHLKNPHKTIAESRRISKRWVIIITPLEDCFFLNLRLRQEKWISEWKLHCGHLSRFSLSILKELLEKNGLELVQVRLCKPPFSSINRSLLTKIRFFILPKVIPSAIHRKLLPSAHSILADVGKKKECQLKCEASLVREVEQ